MKRAETAEEWHGAGWRDGLLAAVDELDELRNAYRDQRGREADAAYSAITRAQVLIRGLLEGLE